EDRGWRAILANPATTQQYATLRSLVIHEVRRLLTGKMPRKLVVRCERIPGKQFLDLALEQLPGGGPGAPRVAVMAIDVTAQVRLEGELAAARLAMLQQERLRSIGEVASGIAHDLNNTLNAMALRLELIKADSSCVAQSDNVDAIGRIVRDCAARIGRLQ